MPENIVETALTGFGYICAFLVAGLVLRVAAVVLYPEQEGVVKYNDCRIVTKTKSRGFWAMFNTYTCDTLRTNSGKIISGECVYIDHPLFSESCSEARIYEKASQIKCPANSQPTVDDKCFCGNGFQWSSSGRWCVPSPVKE